MTQIIWNFIKNKDIAYRISLLTAILLFGLVIHFVTINFLQFVVRLPKVMVTIFALRKELVIAALLWLVLFYNLKRHGLSGWLEILKADKFNRYLVCWFAVLVLITLLSSLFNWSVWQYIIAFRYDFLPFIILLLAYQISKIIPSIDIKNYTKHYVFLIRWIIWFGLIRYFVISSLPGALKLLGYDKTVYEGKLGERPPAVYYAALDHGAPRNQFIRERPIFYGFYLVAFWPLFFFLYLRKATKTEMIFYGTLYVLNVFSTFSRSARWVWILETWLIVVLLYGRFALKYLKYLLLPILAWGFLVSSYFYYEIFWPGRNFSNTGHINAFFEAIAILKDHWLFGQWAWSAGPASHQLGIPFNPENQYLQIWIEYGIFGFLAWILYYGYLNISWLIKWGRNKTKNYLQDTNILARNNQRLVLLACNIWLISLSICGLVLHSLADKMVFWPLMLIYGLRLGMKE